MLSSQIDVASELRYSAGGQYPSVSGGSVNSLDVFGDYMAVAIAEVKQENGYVAIYSLTGARPTLVSAVKVGALPDKVGFSPDGNYIVVSDYSNDPGQHYGRRCLRRS